MSEPDETRRLYREATRRLPTTWLLMLGILALILERAYSEREGPFMWVYVVFGLVFTGVILGGLIHQRRFIRRASPEELRTKTLAGLRFTASCAKGSLVVGTAVGACVILFFVLEWLKGSKSVDWNMAALFALVALAMFDTGFVEAPRALRILRSLPPDSSQSPSPSA